MNKNKNQERFLHERIESRQSGTWRTCDWEREFDESIGTSGWRHKIENKLLGHVEYGAHFCDEPRCVDPRERFPVGCGKSMEERVIIGSMIFFFYRLKLNPNKFSPVCWAATSSVCVGGKEENFVSCKFQSKILVINTKKSRDGAYRGGWWRGVDLWDHHRHCREETTGKFFSRNLYRINFKSVFVFLGVVGGEATYDHILGCQGWGRSCFLSCDFKTRIQISRPIRCSEGPNEKISMTTYQFLIVLPELMWSTKDCGKGQLNWRSVTWLQCRDVKHVIYGLAKWKQSRDVLLDVHAVYRAPVEVR